MYTSTQNPIFPQFCWLDNATISHWMPTKSKNTKITIQKVVHTALKQKEQTLQQSIMQKVSICYSTLINDLKSQQTKYIQQLSQLFTKKQQEHLDHQQQQSIKMQNARQYNQNKLMVFKKRFQELINICQQGNASGGEYSQQMSENYQMVQIILFFIYKVYLQKSTLFPKSPKTQTLYNWIVYTNYYQITNSNKYKPTSNKYQNQPLISAFRLGDSDLILNKLDQILLNSSNLPQDQLMLYIQIFQLLKQRIGLFDFNVMAKSQAYSNRELQSMIIKLQNQCLQKYYMYKSRYPKSQTLLIFKLMSGDVKTIEQIADGNWKVYIMLYILFYKSDLVPRQLFIIARKYVAGNNIKLTKFQALEQLALSLDFNQVYQFSKQYLISPLISTIALIAKQLDIFKECNYTQIQRLTIESDIIWNMMGWLTKSSVKWEQKAAYVKKYVEINEQLQNKEYIQMVMIIIRLGIDQYIAIKNKKDYQRIMDNCKHIQDLRLPTSYQLTYLQNSIKYQTVNTSNAHYIIQLIAHYQQKGGDNNTMEPFYNNCLDNIESNVLNYKHLVNLIAQIPQSKFKQRLINLFYNVCILYQADTSEDYNHGIQIIKYFTQNLLDVRLAGVIKDIHRGMIDKFGYHMMKQYQIINIMYYQKGIRIELKENQNNKNSTYRNNFDS